MSKSKGIKPAKSADPLTKVKDAKITKAAQSAKSKSKDLAKLIAKKDGMKKKAKEPTPEPSSEDETAESSAGDNESESESDVETKPTVKDKANGVELTSEGSPDESESDSDAEADSESEASDTKVEGTKRTAPKAEIDDAISDGDESDTEASDSDESTAADDDSEASSDENESEDEEPAKSVVMGAPLKNDAEGDDTEDSSEESDSDEEAPAKVEPKANGVTKKAQLESDESAEDSDDENSDSDEDSQEADSSEESEKEVKPKSIKRKAEDEVPVVPKKAKTSDVDATKTTLFVGNLSWNVTEDWLQGEFEEFGELKGCRLMTERDTGRSKGFGYVEFANAADAAKAHKMKSGAELDGRNMNVDFANARPSNEHRQENRRKAYSDKVSEPSDTLFLGNLPFDAGQDSVSNAFNPYGTVLGVRLPTDRETGQPKGFGYVTFSSSDEAQAALDNMQGAYLNGRPLRIDFSQPRAQNGDAPQRGSFGGRGRGGFNARGGRGDFNARGGRGGARGGRGNARGNARGGGSTNRGGFNDFKGQKVSFD